MATISYQEEVQRAEALLRDAEYDAARIAFENAINLKPNSPSAAAGLAKVLLVQGAFVDAKKLYGAAFNNGLEKSAEHLTNLAICCALNGEQKNARTLLEGAISVDASYRPAYGALAKHCVVMGDYVAAERYASEGLRIFPNDLPCFEARSLARVSVRNFDGSYADAEEALKLNARSVDGMLCKASVLATRGDLTKAKALLENALQIEPANIEVILTLGNVCQIEGDTEKAEACFQNGLNLHPLDWRVYYFLALLDLLKSRFAEGLSHVDKAIQLQDVPFLHCVRGNLLVKLGRLDEAKMEFTIAATTNPSDVYSLIGLAEIESQNPAERSQAVEHAKRVLSLDQKGAPAERARQLLKSLTA